MVLRLAVIALACLCCTGRVFTGSFDGDSNPLIGKFAFGMNEGGGVVGHLRIDYTTSQNQLVMLEFDDDSWDSVYSNAMTCQQSIAVATDMLELSSATTSAYRDFTERVRPHYWYYTLVNLPDCSEGVQVGTYTLTITQADGNQLSYDEIGMPTAHGVFFGIFLVLLCVHVYGHYLQTPRFRPSMVILVTLASASMTISLLLGCIMWSAVYSSGVVNMNVLISQYVFRVIAHMALWTVAALAANGYGVTTYSLKHRSNVIGVTVLIVILLAYIGGLLFRAMGYDAGNPNVDIDSWPTVMLLVLTIAFGIWFILVIRKTILRELRTDKRLLLWRLSLVLGAHFLVHPITETVSALTPEYERFKVHVAVEFTTTAICLGALMYVLWPTTTTVSSFRVIDGTHRLWLDVHADDATAFVAGDATAAFYSGGAATGGIGAAGYALHHSLLVGDAYSPFSFGSTGAPDVGGGAAGMGTERSRLLAEGSAGGSGSSLGLGFATLPVHTTQYGGAQDMSVGATGSASGGGSSNGGSGSHSVSYGVIAGGQGVQVYHKPVERMDSMIDTAYYTSGQ